MGVLVPPSAKLTLASAMGAGFAAFGSAIKLKYDDNSIKSIKDYEAGLNEYAIIVENDMRSTEIMMNYFHESEKMLTEEIPFS